MATPKQLYEHDAYAGLTPTISNWLEGSRTIPQKGSLNKWNVIALPKHQRIGALTHLGVQVRVRVRANYPGLVSQGHTTTNPNLTGKWPAVGIYA